MKNSKKSLRNFLKAANVLKIQKPQKIKLKGGIVNEDIDGV